MKYYSQATIWDWQGQLPVVRFWQVVGLGLLLAVSIIWQQQKRYW